MIQGIWAELFPETPWPGTTSALMALADEVRMLRRLTDTIVTDALEEQVKRRSYDEIQRAHDLVIQYCLEMRDEATVQFVSPLCWILRHDHIATFTNILATVRLAQLGVQVTRLPELVDPATEQG